MLSMFSRVKEEKTDRQALIKDLVLSKSNKCDACETQGLALLENEV